MWRAVRTLGIRDLVEKPWGGVAVLNGLRYDFNKIYLHLDEIAISKCQAIFKK